jgi:uncharacterized protein (TIGR03086 family)
MPPLHDLEATMDETTMASACDWTERIVEGVTEAQFGLPTPCAEWDVRALMNHVLGTLMLGEALLNDVPPEVAMSPGGQPDADLVGSDPVKAYRSGVERLLAAATPTTLGATHTTPFGEMPGTVLGGFTTVDIAVHGWDLAKATGQERELDDDLARKVLAFARHTLTDDTRAPRIGPAVDVPPTASPTDQLIGFFGRQP